MFEIPDSNTWSLTNDKNTEGGGFVGASQAQLFRDKKEE